MVKEVEKWWNEATPWFQEWAKLSTKSADYGPYAPRENQLKLLGNVKGKKILEIGCGGAQCSISFAKQGAICTGIDITQAQLDYARKLAEKEKVSVTLIKGDIQTLRGIRSNSYDIVFSSFALQYIADLTKCFKEVHRVLKKGGLFVFSIDHPFYNTINPKTKTLKRSYLKTGKLVENEEWSDGIKHKFVMFHRKVSDIVNSIIDANLTLSEMHEPLDMKNKIKDPTVYPEDLVRLIGPTIIFKAKK
ncbi:MAG: methyltransferase domain-containing protein [Candidatus Aenigmatarchaeota archaeon]